MHYTVEITQRADLRWGWTLTAPNASQMSSGSEGDGWPTPSAALRGLQDTARVFLKFGAQLCEWSAEGEDLAGELLKIDSETRKPGMIMRVIHHGG